MSEIEAAGPLASRKLNGRLNRRPFEALSFMEVV